MIGASLIVLGGIGLVLGLGLSIAHRKLAVYVDPREKEIADILPGVNCGACGLPGCSGYAEAIVQSAMPVNMCTVGGQDTAADIARVMGVEAEATVKQHAFVRCQGSTEVCPTRSIYRGLSDCRSANLIGAGSKSCLYGCLGFGSCVSVCPFDAIHVDDNGLSVVDADKCTACGKCVSACPRNIIVIELSNAPVMPLCVNRDRGAGVKKLCSLGCTGCTACVKACPEDAIVMDGNLPVIDYEKCVSCGKCAQKCPTDAMVMLL